MSNGRNNEIQSSYMIQQSDEDLVNVSRSGNMGAFKMLVERHEGKVAGVVKSMLGDTPEALDVGQETFIRFYESMDKFKGDSSVSTYVIRIAINLSLNEIKRRKRKSLFFRPLEDGHHVNTPDTQLDTKEIVMMEVSKLEPEFRAVVTLRLIEGYSTEETATLLEIPLGTVLSRLSRAQKKLKIALTKHIEQ